MTKLTDLITVEQYGEFFKHNEVVTPLDWENQLEYPTQWVIGISWREATAYAKSIGKRLPTYQELENADTLIWEFTSDKEDDLVIIRASWYIYSRGTRVPVRSRFGPVNRFRVEPESRYFSIGFRCAE
jgi:formylglycine-generating enzyme required for sulfatase activity